MIRDAVTDWPLLRLGDHLRLQNGYPFKSTEWSNVGQPIIRIQNLNQRVGTFNHYEGTLPTKYLARPGELLFAWSGTPGTSFGAHIWDGPEAWVNQHIFRVEFDATIFDKQFLRLALNWNLTEYIEGAQGGVGLAHITKAKLNESLLAAPPLSIQRSVADRYERSDAHRARAKAHILAAGDGARRMLRAALASAYNEADTGTPSHSGDVELADLLREPLRNGYSARPVPRATAYRVLTLTATTTGFFDNRQFKYTDEEFGAGSPFWLTPGDIVVQRGNTSEYVGVPALYEGPAEQFLYPDLMIRVRVRQGIDPRFIWYMLMAPQSREHLRNRATGSAGNMPKINQETLNGLPVPLPAERLRTEIVERLDRVVALSRSASSRINVAHRALAKAPHSILAMAFQGRFD